MIIPGVPQLLVKARKKMSFLRHMKENVLPPVKISFVQWHDSHRLALLHYGGLFFLLRSFSSLLKIINTARSSQLCSMDSVRS